MTDLEKANQNMTIEDQEHSAWCICEPCVIRKAQGNPFSEKVKDNEDENSK